MSNATIRLEPADDLDYVERLLSECDLPADDVRSKPDCFFVAVQEGERVGVGGLEQYGTAGLLRSLAVEQSRRGEGFGTAICSRLEERARDDGIEQLWLLTTTAADFFDARGYEEADRSEAPPEIRNTAEFSDLCPDAATCLRASL
ncbi:GNAT family N-acetyltransferase [Halobacteriales archaeon QH_6_66_25]|nr:MAG: GNAT family N-acetyltransferase [Halobacteriales archaeon QH_6_66_25]